MRTSFVLLAAFGASLVSAAPKPVPQDLDADFIADLPDPVFSGAPVGVNAPTASPVPLSSIVAAAVEQATATTTAAAGPTSTDDGQFKKRNNWIKPRGSTALNAATPPGWYEAFKNLNGATQGDYITYKTLSSYSPSDCTAFCDAVTAAKTNGDICVFANLYIEYDEGVTLFKCSLFRGISTAAGATNVGQYLDDGFHVTISDSNGYQKYPVYDSVPGYTTTDVGLASINAPTSLNAYMGYVITANPQACADACEAKTAYNSRHPNSCTYRACNFFNFYTLLKNGASYQTVCAFYISPFDKSYAVNTGYSSGSDKYTIMGSYTYTRNAQQGSTGVVQGGTGCGTAL